MQRSNDDAFRAFAYQRMFDHLSEVREAVSQGSVCVFEMRDQPLECTFGASERINGTWRSVLLTYGSWNEHEEHVRITTRFQDSLAPEMDALREQGHPRCVPVSVHVAPDGVQFDAQLYQVGRSWCTTMTVGRHEVVVTGVGDPPSTVRLERLTDLGPAIDARMSLLRRGGFPA